MTCVSRVEELLNMADDRLEPALEWLEQTVRECVRDEILNLQGGRHGVQNLLERTRNLIRGAAFSSVRELANNLQVRASSQPCSISGCVGSTASTSTSGDSSSAGPSRGGMPRANVVPGHPYRPARPEISQTCCKLLILPSWRRLLT